MGLSPRLKVWIIVAGAMVAALALALLVPRTGEGGPNRVLGVIRDPLALAVIGSALTFLLVDRWRRVEDELSSIRKEQRSALKEIRDDARNIATVHVEEAARKAQAIESRVSRLLTDYPWIVSITENDFLPDAYSCGIILRTAETLISQKRVALAHEYVFHWLKNESNGPTIEGTANDFVALQTFCVAKLSDAYLGYLALVSGYNHAINGVALYPLLLQSAIGYGDAELAIELAARLRSLLDPGWKAKLLLKLKRKRVFQAPDFMARGFDALATFDQLCGLRTTAERYAIEAQRLNAIRDKG